AAIDEDADAIAVSSYQGGHNEYFGYMVDMLRERGCEHIRVVVGGGGTIAPHEIEALERRGVEKIYTPEDGRRMGLAGMIDDVLQRIAAVRKPPYEFRPLNARDRKSTRLNSSHDQISYAVFCLKKKNKNKTTQNQQHYQVITLYKHLN